MKAAERSEPEKEGIRLLSCLAFLCVLECDSITEDQGGLIPDSKGAYHLEPPGDESGEEPSKKG